MVHRGAAFFLLPSARHAKGWSSHNEKLLPVFRPRRVAACALVLIVHVVLFTCSRPGAAKLPVRTALLSGWAVTCGNMATALIWMKVESKTHPGRYYYFNRSTQTSSWKIPPELSAIEVRIVHSVNCRCSIKLRIRVYQQRAGTPDQGGQRGVRARTSAPIEATKPISSKAPAPRKPSKPLLMQIHLNQQNDSKNGGLKCGDPEKSPVERPSSPNTGVLAAPQSHAFNSTGEHSNTFQ